jgi:beta-glucuronidase
MNIVKDSNGEEIFLKGVCIHDEAPGGGRVTTREEVLENIRRAKSLGCNFVRLAHYPHIEMMVKECEKAGLLVWSEIPLYWMIDWNNSATYASAESQLKEMIGRDVRRANVIIWSIANETVPSKKRNEFLKRLAQKARSLDSTRLISMAMEVTYLEDGTYTIKDELNTEVDIISFNEYFGWYVQSKDIPNALWRIPFDKPVIISEFGGGAVAGRHGGVKDRWSEEMQKDIYEKNVKMFGGIKNLSGTCPWILNDFRSPRRPLAGVQDGYNRKGLFAPDGSEKLAAGVMRKYYMREYYLREYFKTKRERPDR